MPGAEVNWGPAANMASLEMSWVPDATSLAAAAPMLPHRSASLEPARRSQSLSRGDISIVSESSYRLAVLKQSAHQTRSQVSGSSLPAWCAPVCGSPLKTLSAGG